MEIHFSTNWNNKVTCRAFTTIRLRNDKKYRIGETYSIWLKSGSEDKCIGYADIAAIKHFRLAELNDYMAYLDTGYSPDECRNIIRKMYQHKVRNIENATFSFILLVKIIKKKEKNTSVNSSCVASGQYEATDETINFRV